MQAIKGGQHVDDVLDMAKEKGLLKYIPKIYYLLTLRNLQECSF